MFEQTTTIGVILFALMIDNCCVDACHGRVQCCILSHQKLTILGIVGTGPQISNPTFTARFNPPIGWTYSTTSLLTVRHHRK